MLGLSAALITFSKDCRASLRLASPPRALLLCHYGLGGCWSRVPCVTAPCCPLSSCPCCCWCGGWTREQVALLALVAGHLPRTLPKHPGARVHGWTADSITGGGGRRPRRGNWAPVSPQQAVGAPSPGVIGWLRRLAEARLGEGKECRVTAARCLWSPESQRQSCHGQEVWWPGGC